MAKKGEEKEKGDIIRRKKKEEQEEKLEDKFAPLKVAHTVQNQIRDFKVGSVLLRASLCVYAND